MYAKAAEALGAAERAELGRLPVAALADERRALQRALAAGPVPEAHHEARAAVARWRRELDEVATERRVLDDRLATLRGTRRWRRNTQSIEVARRSLVGVERRVAVAEVALQRAEAVLGALEQRLPDRQCLADRLDLVEEVLDAKVAEAVARPAPYLTAALSDSDLAPAPWREAAARVEGFRHRQLGWSPGDGAFAGEAGLAGAIGPRPGDYLEALAWDHVAELADPGLAVDVDAPGVDLGL